MNETTSPDLPYKVISSEENPLYRHFGSLCIGYEEYVIWFMRKHGGDAYQGGVYEFRLYPNGCLVMAFPDAETKIDFFNIGALTETCISLECLSYVASAYFWNKVCSEAFERGDERTNVFSHDNFHATRDAVSGSLNFILLEDIGYREPTEDDLLGAVHFIGHPHPESHQFYACID